MTYNVFGGSLNLTQLDNYNYNYDYLLQLYSDDDNLVARLARVVAMKALAKKRLTIAIVSRDSNWYLATKISFRCSKGHRIELSIRYRLLGPSRRFVRPHRSIPPCRAPQLRMRSYAEDVTWRFQKHSSDADTREWRRGMAREPRRNEERIQEFGWSLGAMSFCMTPWVGLYIHAVYSLSSFNGGPRQAAKKERASGQSALTNVSLFGPQYNVT